MPTNRLYYSDSYLTTFSSEIVGRAGDGTRVYLSETAFYPTSGGQPHDLGTLGGVSIREVVDEGERIAHVLAAPLAAGATRVGGTIDWARRFDHMQQHTGQHLLSAVIEDLFGGATVSVHFGSDSSTLDVEVGSLSRQQLVAAEERANALVAEGRVVEVSFEDAGTAAGLRKVSGREGTLRIVTIAGVDRSACGGTHVRTTAELGLILIRSSGKVRQTTRIEFVCGQRALRRARRDHEALALIAESLSASLDDAAGVVVGQAERLRESDSARRRLEKELAGYRVRERYEAAVPGASGVRAIVIRDAASMDDIRALAQAALAFPKVVVVGALSDPPSVLLAASEDSDVDAGKLLKERLGDAGGRGGGSPRIAQGSVPTAAAAEAVVTRLLEHTC